MKPLSRSSSLTPINASPSSTQQPLTTISRPQKRSIEETTTTNAHESSDQPEPEPDNVTTVDPAPDQSRNIKRTKRTVSNENRGPNRPQAPQDPPQKPKVVRRAFSLIEVSILVLIPDPSSTRSIAGSRTS
jgi:hypothetical protein